MVLAPYVISNVEIKNDQITFKTDNIRLVDENKIEIHDVLVGEFDDVSLNEEIPTLFKNRSNTEIILGIEGSLVFMLIEIIIIIFIFSNVEKLFSNIKDNVTPFTLDNVNYIKKMSYLMIADIMEAPVAGIIMNSLMGYPIQDNPLDLMTILEILIIFSMSYIFEYGYEIQKDSKGIMYKED